jgi:ABC-2 type transport system permease protein
MTVTAPAVPRSATAAALVAFGALLARDLTVLRKQPADFLIRTIVQPVLFIFVLGYVSPRIGQPVAGSATQTATTLLAEMLAIAILFQGLFAVALPLVQDLGYTREIDDRLLAPLAALMCASLGLFLGTAIDPRLTMALFAVLITPLMWLGCTLFPWSALHVIPWVQALALADPLTYASEGLRAAVTSQPHLSLLVIYLVLAAATSLLLWQATRHFTRRVIS